MAAPLGFSSPSLIFLEVNFNIIFLAHHPHPHFIDEEIQAHGKKKK